MAITDEQVLRDKLDLEMIERPHLWPGFRVLFLQRPAKGAIQTAMCIKDTSAYIVCAYVWPKTRDEPVTREIIEYPDAAAVRADGWVVD
jgi:hypothetical protein